MATDFYPDPPVTFDAVVEATIPGFNRSLYYAGIDDGLPSILTLDLDDKNFLHAHRTRDGGVVFSRYGANDVEPILRALDAVLGVRIGPAHERE